MNARYGISLWIWKSYSAYKGYFLFVTIFTLAFRLGFVICTVARDFCDKVR